jgi:hypothetical protein
MTRIPVNRIGVEIVLLCEDFSQREPEPSKEGILLPESHKNLSMKIMRKTALVFLGLWLLTPSVHAEESSSFDVFPRAGVGLNWLNYVRLDGSDLDAYFTTLNVGLSVNYDRVYFDLGAELFGVDSNKEGGEVDDVERQDFTFTTGYRVNQDASVFAGYTFGETKDDLKGEFHEDVGPFIGASYSFFSDDTVYTTTLAYAALDGEILVDEDPDANTKGDTTGFSLGFAISGPFRETMGYTIALKTRQYTYEVDDTSQDSDKAITSLNLSLVF